GDRARDARYDFTGNAGSGQRERFLSAPPEDKRIATLQSHDAVAAARFANHQSIDRILPDGGAAGAFSDEEPSRLRRELKRLGIHQRVIEDEIRFLETLDGSERQQFRIARAGTYQGDSARHFTSSG